MRRAIIVLKHGRNPIQAGEEQCSKPQLRLGDYALKLGTDQPYMDKPQV